MYAIVLHMATREWHDDVARVDIWRLISKLQFHSICRDAVETATRRRQNAVDSTTVLDPINVRNSVIWTISFLGRLRTFVFDLVLVLNVSYTINAPLTLVQNERAAAITDLARKFGNTSDFSPFSQTVF